MSPLNMSNQLTELESKIQELKSFGENLAVTLESAAVSFFSQESMNENSISQRSYKITQVPAYKMQLASKCKQNVSVKHHLVHQVEL